MGIRYEKKIVSKYFIYPAEQSSHRFIWVKAALKWTKYPKTAQIVQKGQRWGHFGVKMTSEGQIGIRFKFFFFKVLYSLC